LGKSLAIINSGRWNHENFQRARLSRVTPSTEIIARETIAVPKHGGHKMFKNLSPGAIGIQANIQQTLELAKSTGFGGIDLNIEEAKALAQEHSVQYVADLWSEAGLAMGGWGLPVAWRESDAEYDDSLARLPELAKLAADLGCHRCTTVVRPWSDDLPFKENWDFHVKRLRPFAAILREYGHSLGMEFIGPRTSRAPHKYGFVYTMDGVRALAAAIGTGNVGLLLDTWHWYTCHATLDDLKQLSKDDVVYVHINDAPAGIAADDQIDNVRCLPAETGVIPLGEFMRILDDLGYDGPVTPEPFSQKVAEMAPMDAATATAESLDKVWQQAGLL
jgi:sugar phosphate isomerase/epimerase